MRALVFKYRGLLWGIFAAAVLIFPVTYSPARLIAAVPVLAAGQALRFWAAGIIPKYRTLTLDAPVLVTGGPYSIVRNPLYLGNGIMGCGWSLMAGWWWLAAFAAAFGAVYSLVIIPYEEGFLLERFGEQYREYRASTPQLIPDPRRYRAGDIAFDRAKSWSMERHSLRMNAAVTALVLFRLYLEVI